MSTYIKNLSTIEHLEDNNIIQKTLSSYVEVFINEDSTASYITVKDDYFFRNNEWDAKFIGDINQFKEPYSRYRQRRRYISFNFNNQNLNNELKLVFYNKLFSQGWSFNNVFKYMHYLNLLTAFMNERLPSIDSLLSLDIDKIEIIWRDWLSKNNVDLTYEKETKSNGKTYTLSTPEVTFLRRIYDCLILLIDVRDEWDKDKWDIRVLSSLYGVSFSNSRNQYYIEFGYIKSQNMKNEIKSYFKERLISGVKFSWSTANSYYFLLMQFIEFIQEIEPSWDTLKELERKHILLFIEYLNKHVTNFKHRNANPKEYIYRKIGLLYAFLSDIQVRDYSIAPNKNINRLIFESDKPNRPKMDESQIDYIPDVVLKQLLNNINLLDKKVQLIIWIMFKTGLRISDTVELKQDCLRTLNNKFWLITDIQKVNMQDHRIPIDNQLANMIAVLIDKSFNKSNEDNNPNRYVFVKYAGNRKGRPYTTSWAINQLNALARKINIVDEDNKLYHFKNHAFRHTFAVKLLNGGADILTVQEILAHASPEMTLRYAKLLDDTKRKIFDNAVKQGIFSFDEEDKLREYNNGDVPSDILDMLWTNHKLNAIDTPYGTCMARKNGKCSFAKQPPCLTCNSGSPCKDLGIGIFEGDINKYEILINSTKSLIESAALYNRDDMVKENQELLQLFEEIYNKLLNGNIVYSRLDRLKA